MSKKIQKKMKNEQTKNIAFIDGQNLYMATTKREVDPWKVNLVRFRVYLTQKYGVIRAYYHFGYLKEEHQDLYEQIQKAGFVLVFKKHTSTMLGTKKGNVDSDIIFSAMKRLYKKEDFEKIVLVSNDGDYKMLVDFLIEENKFEKMLFPGRINRSSLYKSLSNKFFAYLDDQDIKNKIGVKKEKGALGS
jgi:uncharacterized LabA/DUF88 family protein